MITAVIFRPLYLRLMLRIGGISFGGVISFIFADLLILPILNIYRKYYGLKMTAVIIGVFYMAMVAAGYAVELIFGLAGLTPDRTSARMPVAGITWNYTTWLNIVFLILASLLTLRFFRTGGRQMLAMLGGGPAIDTRNGDTPAGDGAAERAADNEDPHDH